MSDDYAAYQEEQKYKQKFAYFFAKMLQAVFGLAKLLVKILVETLKGVLQIFKVPIPRV